MDGVLVNNPGADEMTIAPLLFRDETQRVMSLRIDGSFTWAFEGHDALRTAFDSGFCTRVELVIDQRMTPSATWQNIFNGFVYVTDCDFYRKQPTVECKITDNSFSARIDSNRTIKFNVDTARTKSGKLTTVGTPITNQSVDFFLPSAPVGTYGIANVTSYLVIDVLEFLVDAMSNSNMTVSAPIFDTGGDFENLIICTGGAIRFAAGGVGAVNSSPYISYEQIWNTLWKQFNLVMRINGSVVVIELASDQYSASTVLTLTKVMNIHETIEQDKLYTKVIFGSSQNQPSAGSFSFPDIRFFSFQEEEYHSYGDCNHVEQELDLTTDFITDSNVIEDIIVNDNDEYDNDVFLVETDLPGTARAHKYATFPPNFVYNEGFVNSTVALRWDGFIPRSIAYYEGTGDANFEQRLTNASTDFGAHNTAVGSPIVAVDYNSIFLDTIPPGGWNAAGDYYTIPADGFYRFGVEQRLTSIIYADQSSGNLQFIIEIERLDSGGLPYVPVDERRQTNTILFGTATVDLAFDAPGFQCFTNDRIRVNYEYQALGPGPGEIDFSIGPGKIKTFQVVNGGGIFFDYELINIVKWTFQRKLTQADWLLLTASPTDIISVNGTDLHVRQVKWESNTQMAEFVLLENVTT